MQGGEGASAALRTRFRPNRVARGTAPCIRTLGALHAGPRGFFTASEPPGPISRDLEIRPPPSKLVAEASGRPVYASRSLFAAGNADSALRYVLAIEKGHVPAPMRKFGPPVAVPAH